MLITIGDMTDGMGIVFIREFMGTAQYISCYKDQLLFREEDPADSFFTLIQGEVRLTIGINGQRVFTISNPGDVFGWSSLVARSIYSATAVCTNLSDLLIFDRDRLIDLLHKHPDSGFHFFKKLTELIGTRLLATYRILEGKQISGSDAGVDQVITAL